MKKLIYGFFAVAFCTMMCLVATLAVKDENVAYAQGINYTESTQILRNPDRGIYMLSENFVKDSATPTINRGDFQRQLDDAHFPVNTSLFLLNFDLSYYSSNNGGTSKNITSNGLSYIEKTIANCVNDGFNVILRFSYDLPGKCYSHDDIVKFQPEPALSQILAHIKQLAPIVNKYKDYVYVLQSGMFGPWGEQHSSKLSKDVNAYYQMLDAWLTQTDESIWVGVRYPYHFLDWYNTKYGYNYDGNNIQNIKTKEGTPEYRVCMYDDGYLADAVDWGTFHNRTNEIAFLHSQTYAPFGGEACSEKTGGLTQYTAISNVEVEAFKTHTSYLNYQWDYDKVIKFWEKQTYTGKDAVYKNAKTTELTYIINRLGYRLVLRSSEVSSSVKQGEKLNVNLSIENVGFGNISRKQDVYIVLASSDGKVAYSALTSMNAQSLLSQKTVNLRSSVIIPSSVQAGTYSAYLKILPKGENFNDGSRAIQLANPNIFNGGLGANYIGDLTVQKGSTKPETSTSENSSASSTQTSSQVSPSTKSEIPQKTSAVPSQSASVEQTKSSSMPANSSSVVIVRPPRDSKKPSGSGKKKGCSSSFGAESALLCVLCLIVLAILARKNKKS